MTDTGWFALYRGALNHPIFRRGKRGIGEYSDFEAWVWLLSNAAYQPMPIWIGGQKSQLEAGQLSVTTRKMADAWGWGETSVRDFLKRLENDNMISRKKRAGSCVITICNYVVLQPSQEEYRAKTAQETRKNRARNAQSLIKEEGNKISPPNGGDIAPAENPTLFAGGLPPATEASPSRKSPKRPAREETEFPDGFELDGDLHRYAEDAGIPFQEIPAVWERFKNYHIAKGTRFKDWRAAWRTWVGNEIKYSRDRRGNGGGRPERAAYDPIEFARGRMKRIVAEEEGSLWHKEQN